MSDNSSIEWTDASWTPLRARFTDPITGAVRIGWHCEHVSSGCIHCYSEQINKGFFQLGTKQTYTRPSREKVEIFLDEEVLQQPLHWKKPRKIFVCSMTDLFGEWHTDEMILKVFDVIRRCEAEERGHVFQLLTKRAERMYDFCSRLRFVADGSGRLYLTEGRRESGYAFTNHLKHCWFGVSVENQPTADERVPWLLKTPAAVRFVSYEPALGPVDFRHIHDADAAVEIDSLTGDHGVLRPLAGRSDRKIDLVICGGESGPGARPMHPDWARSTRDQCVAAGVKFFFKQHGNWRRWEPGDDSAKARHVSARDGKSGTSPGYVDGDYSCRSDTVPMSNVGKKAAGRLLDGREWNEMPEVAG